MFHDLNWKGYTQVTVRICPTYLQCSSRKADQLRVDFKSFKNNLHVEKHIFIHYNHF